MDDMEAMKYFNRKDYRRALDIHLEMLEDANRNKDEKRIAYNANLSGLCLYFLHRYDEAKRYFDIALEHTEGDEKQKVQKNINEMERYVQGLEKDIHEIELHLKEDIDEKQRGILLSNLGILKYLQGSNNDAEKHLKSAEHIFKKTNEKIALGAIYTNFAMLYDNLRELDYLYKALDIFNKEGHLKGQADVYHSLSLHYLFQNHLEEAQFFLKKEMEIVNKISDRSMQKRCYRLAADMAIESGVIDEGMKFTEMLSKI